MSRPTAHGFGETVRTVIYAVLIAVGVRTLAYEAFNIPSGSMKPTLLIGDYLFVAKFSYGYSRYSLPFGLPIIPGRLMFSEPERGDVAVFKLPRDNATDYIKRIIGLPGDRIQMREGVLHINGTAVQRRRIDDFVETNRDGFAKPIKQYEETLPNGVVHRILETNDFQPLDDTREFTVPQGHFFAMGDNRDNSSDSRTARVGFIPRDNLVGRAEVLFFSIDGAVIGDAPFLKPWRWKIRENLPSLRFSRFFDSVD